MCYRNPWKRLLNATIYSIKGIRYAIEHEQAFQYECVILIAIYIFLLIKPLSLQWNLVLVGAWLLVMVLELINSAVERAFDLIDTNIRPEIGAGKDMLSAAVFIVVCFNIALWFSITITQC